MQNFNDLISLAKGIRLLYVEDDEALRLETMKILEHIFDCVEGASNGQEGLERLETGDFDLVITDIEMPVMTGIEMSEKIRSIDEDMVIVITSAYSNTDYFLKAISAGINYYIIKPINMPHLVDTLYSAVKGIIDKRHAHQFRLNEITRKLQQVSQDVLSEITNISPNPLVLYTDGKISFMNHAFTELFEEEDLKKLINQEQCFWNFLNDKISIDSVVHEKNDFIEQLDESENNEKKYKISLKTKLGRKIFFVFKNLVDIDDTKNSVAYTFNDITVLEYQKVQIDQYNEYMSELMYSKYKLNKTKKQAEIINKTSF